MVDLIIGITMLLIWCYTGLVVLVSIQTNESKLHILSTRVRIIFICGFLLYLIGILRLISYGFSDITRTLFIWAR